MLPDVLVIQGILHVITYILVDEVVTVVVGDGGDMAGNKLVERHWACNDAPE